ncbi:proline-rich protein [Mycena floridula]|nr:proline-rich protein [Mycena floridula]
MWLVTAPFESQDANYKETRILKTGTTVSLGRKHELLLRIPIPKVSNHVFDLTVAEFSEDDITDSSTRPKIEIANKLKNEKIIRITRNGTMVPCNAGCTVQIFDGDEVQIANGVFVVFSWQNICCYIENGLANPAVSTEGCQEFGIHVVMESDPRTTHHLTSTYECTAAMADSLLLSCQFVKPQWLTELFRLANSEVNKAFILPETSNYRPSFAATVPLALKVQALWEPSEERMKMFKEVSFLCIGDKGGRGFTQSFKKMLATGDGFVDNFNGHEGKAKWARLLSRHAAKTMRKWVAVADPSPLTAVLGEQWENLVEVLHEHERIYVTPEEVITAVIKINLAPFFRSPNDSVEVDNAAPSSPAPAPSEPQSSLPTRIPNTFPEEASAPPPTEEQPAPTRKLLRRAVSRQPSQEPEKAAEPPAEEPRPRRALTRRVNAGVPLLTGIDDPSMLIDAAALATAMSAAPPTPAAPRTGKLKRRAGTAVSNDFESQLLSTLDEESNPLKKFKALYDEIDPDNISQTQAETTQSGSGSGGTRSLIPVREEEEEESQNVSRGQKRKSRGEDIEMAGVEEALAPSPDSMGPPAAKKRATEERNAVQRAATVAPAPKVDPPASPKKPGAAAGKPDTDAAFLKALASKKRGKKTEDEFDREFNKLKISKPDLRTEDEDWGMLDDFGQEKNLRGNFMMLVEFDVYKDLENRRKGKENHENHVHPEWDGVPNYKKFRKTTNVSRRNKIELVMNKPTDGDIDDPATWKKNRKEKAASTQGFAKAGSTQGFGTQAGGFGTQAGGFGTQAGGFGTQAESSKRAATPVMVIDSDEEDEEQRPPSPLPAKSKASSRAKSKASSRATTVSRAASVAPSTRSSRRTAALPLFLSDDDEEEEDRIIADDDDDDFDDVQTLRSVKSTVQPLQSNDIQTLQSTLDSSVKPTRKRKVAAVDDGDSGVFQGFGGGGTKRTRR